MDSNGSDRRRFLKHAAALAGVSAGAGASAEWAALGQSAKAETQAQDAHVRGEQQRRGVRMSVDHITYYTPLQDLSGIITPTQLHFVQYHASHFPDIDPQQHRLTIHGLVERPLSFSMDDLRRLPSVSRIHFLECHANSSPMVHGAGNENMGLPVQYVHGMTSCSEWSGVPLSVLLNEAGVKKEGTWLVSEGADPCRFSHTLPVGKAMEDVIVAYGQNGEPLRREQGFPIRLVVPGWEGPFSVKYLHHIKVTDQPYHAWNESMKSFHPAGRPGLEIALVPFPVRAEIDHYAAVRRSHNSRPWLCGDYRYRVVRWRQGQEGRRIHRRRPQLEGSQAADAGAFAGAYPVYVRLGLGRPRSGADVALHGRTGRRSALARGAL